MLQALDHDRRQVGDLGGIAPHEVAFHHSDDLVVGLAAIEELQAPDHARRHDHLGAGDRPLGEHADVERIGIAALRPGAQRRHLGAAIGPRNEAVERRRLRRSALRPVDPEVAARLVDLVLDEIKGRDLDIGIHEHRELAPGLEAVPRMRAPFVEFGPLHGLGNASMPFALITAAAAGAFRKPMKLCAAAGSFAPAPIAARNAV